MRASSHAFNVHSNYVTSVDVYTIICLKFTNFFACIFFYSIGKYGLLADNGRGRRSSLNRGCRCGCPISGPHRTIGVCRYHKRKVLEAVNKHMQRILRNLHKKTAQKSTATSDSCLYFNRNLFSLDLLLIV